MQAHYHLCGGAGVLRKVKAGASFANAGIGAIDGTAGAIPVTTTDGADAYGLALDTATYSTTQGDAEGLVTIDIRPDLVIRARMSGGATEGTALTTLSNTLAETAGTTVTDADVGTASSATGTLWCTKGANVGQSRIITTFNSATDVVVTVPFKNDIAAGDEFLWCPYNACDAGAGGGNVQTTTLFTEANAAIVAGTGLVAAVCDLELNGRLDSYVQFILADHAFGTATL